MSLVCETLPFLVGPAVQAAPLEGLGVPGFGGLGALGFFGLGVLGFGFRARGLGLQGLFQFKESDMQGCKGQGSGSVFGVRKFRSRV